MCWVGGPLSFIYAALCGKMRIFSIFYLHEQRAKVRACARPRAGTRPTAQEVFSLRLFLLASFALKI